MFIHINVTGQHSIQRMCIILASNFLSWIIAVDASFNFQSERYYQQLIYKRLTLPGIYCSIQNSQREQIFSSTAVWSVCLSCHGSFKCCNVSLGQQLSIINMIMALLFKLTLLQRSSATQSSSHRYRLKGMIINRSYNT